MVGAFEQGNETLGSINCWEFLDLLKRCYFNVFQSFSPWKKSENSCSYPDKTPICENLYRIGTLVNAKSSPVTVLPSHCHYSLFAKNCYMCVSLRCKKQHRRNFPVFRKYLEFSCGISEFQNFYAFIWRFVSETFTRHFKVLY